MDLILKNRIDLQVAGTVWVKHQVKVFHQRTTGHTSPILSFKERLRRRLSKRGFEFANDAALEYTIMEFSQLSGVPLRVLLPD